MPSKDSPTTIRFTADDRKVLDKLQKLTGLGTTAAIRMAIREVLADRVARAKG